MKFVHSLVLELIDFQGELEHRVGKNRFARTSRKDFIPQLASIERRQARTRRIRSKLAALQAGPRDSLSDKPEDRYHIGQTQNFPEDLVLFVRKNLDDPLTKVCGLGVGFMYMILTWLVSELYSATEVPSITTCPDTP